MKNKKIAPITTLTTSLLLGFTFTAVGQMNQPGTAEGQSERATGASEHTRVYIETENQRTDRENRDKNKSHHSELPKSSSDLLGMDIKTAGDENIGSIDDIYVDMQSGKIVALVVSTGGFLGMGTHQSLISPKDVRYDREGENLHTSLTEAQIRSAPEYDSDNTANIRSIRPLTTDRDQADRNRADDSMAATQGGTLVALSDLDGANVENHEGDNVGNVDKVYINLKGSEVAAVVVSTGGFLGVGGQQNVLPLSEMRYDAEEDRILVSMTREQLRASPVYREDDFSWRDSLRDQKNRHDAPRGASPTVFDQGNTEQERDVTANIRRSITENDYMSNSAKNVTIITQEDSVLLRGEVENAAEKDAVEALARSNSGHAQVVSELTVRSR